MRVDLGSLIGLGDCYDTEGNDIGPGCDYAGTPPSYTLPPFNPPPVYPSLPASSGAPAAPSYWDQIFGGVISNVGKVYATRNAVPQLNSGESITQLANGTYQVTQQPAGVAASGGSLSIGTSSTLGGLSLPLLIGVGVVAVMMMNKGGR